jgi:hypothetical protein
MVDFLLDIDDIRDGSYQQLEAELKSPELYLSSGHPYSQESNDDGTPMISLKSTKRIMSALEGPGINLVAINPSGFQLR